MKSRLNKTKNDKELNFIVILFMTKIIVILFIFFGYLFWHQTRASLELNFNVRIVMRLLFYIG